jgi:FtsP/CotA-like multicopper oxidase with cupredoxin domain
VARPSIRAIAGGQPGLPAIVGDRINLTISPLPVNITGRPRLATAGNRSVPAPLLRLREGDTVTIRVTNRLAEPMSIH